jgi:hypothetical protein
LDIGKRGFIERIKHLQEKLEINIDLSEDENEALVKWSRIRNALVHDRSTHKISIGNDFNLLLEAKENASDAVTDGNTALFVFNSVAAKLFRSTLPSFSKDQEAVEKIRVSTKQVIDYLLITKIDARPSSLWDIYGSDDQKKSS